MPLSRITLPLTHAHTAEYTDVVELHAVSVTRDELGKWQLRSAPLAASPVVPISSPTKQAQIPQIPAAPAVDVSKVQQEVDELRRQLEQAREQARLTDKRTADMQNALEDMVGAHTTTTSSLHSSLTHVQSLALVVARRARVELQEKVSLYEKTAVVHRPFDK